MDDNERKRLEHQIRAEVTKRVRAKMGFYWHAVVFAMVNGALMAINLFVSGGYPWSAWPLAAWGCALILHWIAVFPRSLSADMIEDEIKREMTKRGLT